MKRIVSSHQFWIGVAVTIGVTHFVLPMVKARTAAKTKTN